MKAKFLLTLVAVFLFAFAKSQVAPSFNGGTRQNLTICQNSGSNSIDSKLVTTDPDAGQSLTYTVTTAPIYGTVHGFPGLQSTGAGGIVSPSGFDYTPTNGYNGLDSFTVNVSDGSFSAQTKIVVTINSLPTVAAITGTASACISTTSQLNNATSGGVWSSSNIFVADISNTGLVTGQAAGTAIISYTVTNGTTGCSNTATTNFIVGGYPVVQAITGTNTVCVGATTQLSDATAGGKWTSGNTTRATVDQNSGLVTGVGAGTVTITYTVTNTAGCSTAVTRSVTVNASPTVNAISATTTTICVGSTTTLTNNTNGGNWTSTNTSIATVTATGGGGTNATVTGIATGIDTIKYTVTNGNGCTNSVMVEITVTNGVTVAPITGPTTVCTGKSITLANATTGGTWSITTGGFRASITQSGVLSATAAGAVTVTYSVTGGGGCSKSVTYNITVSNSPTLSSISGSNQVCVGSTTALTNSTAGGTWTSSNTSLATVSTGGIVTGVAPGIDTIKYTVTNGAGCTDSVIFSITVTSSITVSPIVGASSVCMGATLLLTDATAGGTWNSSDLSIAAVVNGTVYPIAPGVVAITYTVGSGACAAVASKNVIIYESPNVGAITGNTAICVGSTSQLSNTTTGGVWSSSNTTKCYNYIYSY
ncbi:MAG: Ig-like domain-containing protein [Bacteroidetes bacterium]|nr:Ig-like domain-containing protein [Bacteroidota bacterium]